MNCHSAQRLLSAERDGALASPERAGLAAHVAGCAECRQFQVALAVAAEDGKTAAARVAVPDEERAWQDIHRELRAARTTGARELWGVVRWALPLGAAAALAAFMVFFQRDEDESATPTVARAEFVEVSGDASSVVYVDDKSGWLVVWAAPAAKSG